MLSCVHALFYEDCNLQADRPDLKVMAYRHFPDPEVATENHTIAKEYHYTGMNEMTIFKEFVQIDRSDYSPYEVNFQEWTKYFNNTINICDTHPEVCPIEPNTYFSTRDDHGPSNSEGAWFRAQEHYFNQNDEWIGCVTTVYQTVN
jgi:hypothetical protein